jgi:predicted RNA-binding Zn ribbon-like protein
MRVRACAGKGCSLFFLDTSRAGRRRWCAMAACGNKEKVGAFRQRRQGSQEV